jgi:multiple sugar transport system permease protein
MIGVESKNIKTKLFNYISYFIIFAYLLFVLFPIFWIGLISLKTEAQAFANPPVFIFKPYLLNYYYLFAENDFLKYLLNSIFIASFSTLLSLIIGTPMAYAVARNKSKFNERILIWVLISRMAPAMTFIIPYFIVFSYLKIIDTHFGLIIAYCTLNLPLVIWLMRSFFLDLPTETLEAARIDGASTFVIFRKIALPLTTPGLVSTGIITFVVAWNEFIFALVLTRRDAVTAQIGIGNLIKYENTEWGQMAAGALILIIPAIFISLFISKFLVRGLTSGSTKG